MLIKIETTVNPDIRNFYPGQKIMQTGASEFADAKSLRKSPLAEAIFDLGGIENLLMTPDMIVVTKKKEAQWEDLSPQIMAEIADFAVMGAEAVINTDAKENDPQDLMKKICSLTDARIRPALHKDGGDLEIRGFENGILWVELTGKCAGCPYAMRTLKEGVEKILKDYIPQIVEVKPVQK